MYHTYLENKQTNTYTLVYNNLIFNLIVFKQEYKIIRMVFPIARIKKAKFWFIKKLICAFNSGTCWKDILSECYNNYIRI